MCGKGEIQGHVEGTTLIFEKGILRPPPSKELAPLKEMGSIFIGRAGTWEGNMLHFKVKVQNSTAQVITNINVVLDQYPPMLQLKDEKIKSAPLLQPRGAIWTPEFRLYAGNECVSGLLYATVSYFDYTNEKYALEVQPLEISFICPILEAKTIEEIEYLRKLRNMTSAEARIDLEILPNMPDAMAEMRRKFAEMNLAVLPVQGASNEVVSYAEDKIKKDGVALEAKLELMKTQLLAEISKMLFAS